MNAQYTTHADISRALLEHVVNPKGNRPHLEITTPNGSFHMVEVQQPILPTINDDRLTSIIFFGKQPIGRKEVFIWPPDEVELPALAITEISVYDT